MIEHTSLPFVQGRLRDKGFIQKSETEWRCAFPAHDDREASVSVSYGTKQPNKVRFRCAVCGGLDKPELLKFLDLSMVDFIDKGARSDSGLRGVEGGKGDKGEHLSTQHYIYRDENAAPLFRVARVNYTNGKKFSQQGVDGRKGWKQRLGDATRVLYRLPELIDAIDEGWTIHLTEGEKDADALNAYFKTHDVDAFATCHPMGAGKWRPAYTSLLTGADAAVVWADRDGPGYRCASQRLSAILAAGIPARAVLPMPDQDHADAYDHLHAGFGPDEAKPVTREELAELAGDVSQGDEVDDVLEAVRQEFLVAAAGEQTTDHLDDALYDEDVLALPPQRFVIDRWVPAGAYTGIYGPPGIGKTLILLSMHRAVRKGTRWQDQATTQGMAVSYVGEEVHQLQDRMRAWDARYPLREDQTMEPGVTIPRLVDLTKREAVAAVIRTVRLLEAQHSKRVQLLTFDPLVEFMTGDENGDGMDQVTRGLRALATLLDCAVVVGHHTNASEARARGADHLRMRCGAHIRMEHVDEVAGTVGLLQEKQRNAAKAALVLETREEKPSVVLEWQQVLMAQDYVADKISAKRRDTAEKKQAQAHDGLAERVVNAMRSLHNDGDKVVSQSRLNKQSGGNHATFKTVLDTLVEQRVLDVRPGKPGKATEVSFTDKYLRDYTGEDA